MNATAAPSPRVFALRSLGPIVREPPPGPGPQVPALGGPIRQLRLAEVEPAGDRQDISNPKKNEEADLDRY